MSGRRVKFLKQFLRGISYRNFPSRKSKRKKRKNVKNFEANLRILENNSIRPASMELELKRFADQLPSR